MLDSSFDGYLDSFEPYQDELDACERGEAKEVPLPALTLPVKRDIGWVRCFVVQSEGGGFRLYLEGSNTFLLSAKRRQAGDILISAFEDFVHFTPHHKHGYIARLSREGAGGGGAAGGLSCVLTSRQCSFCAPRLGLLHCNKLPISPLGEVQCAGQALGCVEGGEILARVTHVSIHLLHRPILYYLHHCNFSY